MLKKWDGRCHCWQDGGSEDYIERPSWMLGILHRWQVVQHELIPELKQELGPLTARLEKLIHTPEWVRIEALVESSWSGKGRPPHDRGALANAFVAKALLGLGTTAAESSQGVVIRVAVAGEIAKSDRIVGGLLNAPTGEDASSVAIDEQAHEAGRMVGFAAAPGIGAFDAGQVKAFITLAT